MSSVRKHKPRPGLTEGRLAGEHRGGQSPRRGAVDVGGSLDQVGGLLQQTAGDADVVDPQEAAAGEGQVPSLGQVEHQAARHGTGRPGGRARCWVAPVPPDPQRGVQWKVPGGFRVVFCCCSFHERSELKESAG